MMNMKTTLSVALLLAVASLMPGLAHAESPLKGGTIHLLQSSHHDLGYHKGSYADEMRFTLDEIDRALDLMNEDPEFTFTGEYTVWLHEYLKRRPARVDELKQRFREGRMEWGAGYTMPYTSMITCEQLARQMYFGRRWFNREFPAEANVYFNTDVPAFGIQMPQILKKSGVDKAFLSRSMNLSNIDTDFADWIAPDGSTVFCYFMHHYGAHCEGYGNPAALNNWVQSLEKEYVARRIPPHLIHFVCMDCWKPRSYRKQIDAWNAFAGPKGLPGMHYSTLGTAMDAVNSEEAKFKTLFGEWPSKWVYEAAPSNYQLVSDQRQSDRLLRAAEAFSTFRALLEGGFENYPAGPLAEAWKKGIFSCHGFSPDPSIELYAEKYRAARDTGEQTLQEALAAITRQIGTDSRGLPLVVYNTLSWNRDDIVQFELPASAPADFQVVDQKGTAVPHQRTSEGRLVFRAEAVPSFGYKTYYLVKARSDEAADEAADAPWRPNTAWQAPFENAFFVIEPGNGGLKRIFDKELQRELLRVDRFLGAEWLDYQYTGQGAGRHIHIKLPAAHGFDRLQNYGTEWSCIESGPVRTVFESKAVETPRGKVQLRLAAYTRLKRIDLECRMVGCDEKAARQIRLAFPLNAHRREVAYEVPFGVVEIGQDELEPALVAGAASVRPRETQNWIYAGDDQGGVTIGSSVVAWDYDVVSEDRPESLKSMPYPVLQPVLLTSAYSCNRWKRCWTQPGDHTFTFSLYSHQPGWKHGYREGVQSNNPLIAMQQKAKDEQAELPETKSFLSIAPENVIVTAVKKSEDGSDVIVRFYEMEGQSGRRAELRLDAPLSDARRTNLIEEDAGPLKHDPKSATLDARPYSIETVKLTPVP